MANWQNTLYSLFLKGFCILWGLWVILEYLSYHSYYLEGIVDNPNLSLFLKFVVGTLILLGVLEYRRRKSKSKTVEVGYRGIGVVGIFFLISLLILHDFISAQTRLADISLSVRFGYFIFFGLALLAAIYFISLTAHGVGKVLLNKTPLRYGQETPFLAIAIGFSVLGLLLLLMGMMGLLQTVPVWIVMMGAFALGIRSNLQFSKDLFLRKYTLSYQQVWPAAIWALILFIVAIQFIASIKAYPVGFDGASVYLNQPNLIAEYGALPEGSNAFNWGVIMSLGPILFGQTTISILLSQFMGVFCVFGIFFVARKWLPERYAILAASIPLLSQYYGFHTMADEKTDLAFLFFAIACVLLAFPEGIKKKKPGWLRRTGLTRFSSHAPAWLLAGWVAGFAFGIKYTAVFLLISLGVIAFYRTGKTLGALGCFLLAISGIFIAGIYRAAYLPLDSGSALLIGGGTAVLGAASLYWVYRSAWKKFWSSAGLVALLLVASGIAFAPWGIRNFVENRSINLSALTQNVSTGPELNFEGNTRSPYTLEERAEWLKNKDSETFRDSFYQSFDNPPVVTETDRADTPPEKEEELEYNASVYEEVIRYLGYENGLWKYTSIPYDLTTNVNIPFGRYLDIGFLLLLFLPLLLLALPTGQWSMAQNSLLVLGLVFWVASTYYAMHVGPEGLPEVSMILNERQAYLNAQPGGGNAFYWQIYTAVLGGILALAHGLSGILAWGENLPLGSVIGIMMAIFAGCFVLFHKRLKDGNERYGAFVLFLWVYIFSWWILGNGIVWYGFLFWALVPILIIKVIAEPETFLGIANRKFSRLFTSIAVGLFLFGNTMVYITNPISGGQRDQVFPWQMIEYATNPNFTKKDVLENYNPFFNSAIAHMNSDLSVKVFGVNTYLGYHVKRNDQRLLNDMVLALFDEIVSQTERDDEFFDILKENGFRYILYDLGTASVDQTPERTLSAKCERFVTLLTQSDKVELLITDNYVHDSENGDRWVSLPNGEKYLGRGDLVGQVITPGSFALYEIK